MRSHPDMTFVFGDNLRKQGEAGQAIIRYEQYAFGIPTRTPSSKDKLALFYDQAAENAACVPVERDGYRHGPHGQVEPRHFSQMNSILGDLFQFMHRSGLVGLALLGIGDHLHKDAGARGDQERSFGPGGGKIKSK